MQKIKKYVLIVAGGSGTRMGSEIPKQFMVLSDKPILMHTIDVFKAFDKNIHVILVLPKNQFAYWENLKQEYHFTHTVELAGGGINRFESVRNGLSCIKENGLVGIHDGVRPFVSIETITKCYHKAGIYGAAIPVRNMHESLRFSDGNTNYAVNRNLMKAVQTPQVFRTEVVKEAYQQVADGEEFTDDASVVERNGIKIQLVEGNQENIKITTPLDLKIGLALLNERLI